jgi:hypothetical protein
MIRYNLENIYKGETWKVQEHHENVTQQTTITANGQKAEILN